MFCNKVFFAATLTALSFWGISVEAQLHKWAPQETEAVLRINVSDIMQNREIASFFKSVQNIAKSKDTGGITEVLSKLGVDIEKNVANVTTLFFKPFTTVTFVEGSFDADKIISEFAGRSDTEKFKIGDFVCCKQRVEDAKTFSSLLLTSKGKTLIVAPAGAAGEAERRAFELTLGAIAGKLPTIPATGLLSKVLAGQLPLSFGATPQTKPGEKKSVLGGVRVLESGDFRTTVRYLSSDKDELSKLRNSLNSAKMISTVINASPDVDDGQKLLAVLLGKINSKSTDSALEASLDITAAELRKLAVIINDSASGNNPLNVLSPANLM